MQIRWSSSKRGKGTGKNMDMMNIDLNALMKLSTDIDKKEIKNENELEQIEMTVDKNINMEMKSNITDRIKFRNNELRKIKGVLDYKEINGIIDKDKGNLKEIDKNEYLLETKFDIESLPKLSDGIVNKNVIQNVPLNLQSLVPSGFNFKELDHKFSDFIKFLFISRKHITKKNFKFLVDGIFEILTELGVEPEIKNKFISF